MLFKTLKRVKERGCLTAEMENKVDVLYVLGRLTDSEYKELMGEDIIAEMPMEGEPIEPIE